MELVLLSQFVLDKCLIFMRKFYFTGNNADFAHRGISGIVDSTRQEKGTASFFFQKEFQAKYKIVYKWFQSQAASR